MKMHNKEASDEKESGEKKIAERKSVDEVRYKCEHCDKGKYIFLTSIIHIFRYMKRVCILFFDRIL